MKGFSWIDGWNGSTHPQLQSQEVNRGLVYKLEMQILPIVFKFYLLLIELYQVFLALAH